MWIEIVQYKNECVLKLFEHKWLYFFVKLVFVRDLNKFHFEYFSLEAISWPNFFLPCPFDNHLNRIHWFPAKGTFTFYVDNILRFFVPSLPIRRQIIWWSLSTCVDTWLTPPSLSYVYVRCGSPPVNHSLSQIHIDYVMNI